MTSYIELIFTTHDIGAPDTFVIDDKLLTPSDHKVIICGIVYPNGIASTMCTTMEITGSNVEAMYNESRMRAANT